MPRSRSPLRMLFLSVFGWIARQQQDAIDYLREENRVLRELLAGTRLRFSEDQRRRLAVRGKVLGRALLRGLATIVSPDTVLGWHRKLVARKWAARPRRVGDRVASRAIPELVLRMAAENPTWGYVRIRGALSNLGHTVSATRIRGILKQHGVDPAPVRGKHSTWRTFLKAHAAVTFAADFFTTEVWTLRGLVTYHTLFVIHHATRVVRIIGTTATPDAEFMASVARSLSDPVTGFLRRARFLILDRDTKFGPMFRSRLESSGIRLVICPPRSPNCNAFAERFVLSIKSECLRRMIFIGGPSLQRALREFETHYNRERNHRGIGNALIEPDSSAGRRHHGPVIRRERLGGLLSFYRRCAAA